MAYSSSENAIRSMSSGLGLKLIVKADTDQSKNLRALRVYVPDASAPATLKVTPSFNEDGTTVGVDADAVTLTFPAGISWEPIHVRRVWSTGSTSAAVVHGVPVGA